MRYYSVIVALLVPQLVRDSLGCVVVINKEGWLNVIQFLSTLFTTSVHRREVSRREATDVGPSRK